MDLTCKEFVELLTDYLEGTMSVPERVRVEQHVVVCAGCARYADQVRAMVRLSGTLLLEEFGAESRRVLLANLDEWISERR